MLSLIRDQAIVVLDKYCPQGNLVKIHQAESTENTSRASRLKSFKCDQNFACSSIYALTG